LATRQDKAEVEMKRFSTKIALVLLLAGSGSSGLVCLAQRDQGPTLEQTQDWLNTKLQVAGTSWVHIDVQQGVESAFAISSGGDFKSKVAVQAYTVTPNKEITSVESRPCKFKEQNTICVYIAGKHSLVQNKGLSMQNPPLVRIYLTPGTSDSEANSIVKAFKRWAILNGAKLVNDDLFK
jgi:hypothetical protein